VPTTPSGQQRHNVGKQKKKQHKQPPGAVDGSNRIEGQQKTFVLYSTTAQAPTAESM